MIVSRFASIACVMTWLKKWGYGLTWKEVYVLAYGGLRGAIGIFFIFKSIKIYYFYRNFVCYDYIY